MRLDHLLHLGLDESEVVLAFGVDGQTVVDQNIIDDIFLLEAQIGQLYAVQRLLEA